MINSLVPACTIIGMSVRWLLLWTFLLAGCATGSHLLPVESADVEATLQITSVDGEVVLVPPNDDDVSTFSTSPSPTTPATTPPPMLATAYGRVLTSIGQPLLGVTVEVGDGIDVTDENGWFLIESAPEGLMTLTRPAWTSIETQWSGGVTLLAMEPFIVRGIRANRTVFIEARWDNILSLADQSTVNTLVFDTKDESGQVLYQSSVPLASEIGAINVLYDPGERIAEARAHGLYTITRIVTFEDNVWSRSGDARIVGSWIDARDELNWDYPIALAVEACELGFDEIQFDYVRFPAGTTGGELNRREGLTQEIRLGAIASFLEAARAAIRPLGCAVSADVFAIVMSSPNDQGIGQRPEELSEHLDAISPMIYPSHYGDGWLGFADPNEHNAEVTADALDDGAPRLAEGTLMRPWLQAFFYNASEVLEVSTKRKHVEWGGCCGMPTATTSWHGYRRSPRSHLTRPPPRKRPDPQCSGVRSDGRLAGVEKPLYRDGDIG